MRKILFIIFILLAIFSCSTVKSTTEMVESTSGTVKFMDLEGGFFGIITASGEKHDPINLDEDYKIDGLSVSYSYKVHKDMMSIHMWGTIIEIIEIEEKE